MALDDMLRDRLVCVIQNGNIQQKLQAEVTIMFERSMQISLMLERVEKNLRDLQEPVIDVFNKVVSAEKVIIH